MNIKLTRYGDYRDGKLMKFAQKLKERMNPTLLQIGKTVESSAKTLVPVRTGALQKSIHTEKVSDNIVWVGPEVEYGIYPEYGTINMNAQPYMRPAADIAFRVVGKQFSIQIVNAWESS